MKTSPTAKLQESTTNWARSKRLLTVYTSPYKTTLVMGLLAMVFVAALSAAPAKLIEPIIDDIFVSRKLAMLWPVTLMVFGVFLFKGIATYMESVFMTFVGQRIVTDIQKDLFSHLMKADFAYFHKNPSGQLISHFINDVAKLQTAVTGTLTNIVKDALTLAFFIAIMFHQDWFLASIAFFILPLAILPVARMGKKIRKVSTNVQEEMSTLTTLLNQAFQGMRLVKSYCMENYEIKRVWAVMETITKRTMKAMRIKAASHPLMEFLGGVAIAIVIYYGGSTVIKGEQNPGAFFSFIAALIMAYEPLKRLANLNANFQEQMASATRVFDLLDEEPRIQEKADGAPLAIDKGSIQFESVDFSYETRPGVLNAVNLKLDAGKTTAFVGPSGGGKSTLLNLIPRFYDVNAGSIMIDGQNIAEVTIRSLREQIALVSQEIVLFDDTIEANIRFGKPGASLGDVKKAAEAAAADSFIEGLPEGYQTMIGEHGVKLSGGQRQRIAIARAMLKDAPILLLDEPTSALDTESELLVQTALKKLMKGRTTLIIAHRLSTIRDADCIYYIDQGRVLASGTHETLIGTCAAYEQLCKTQFSRADVG
jgi:subfamily B ATP-binding cassette protein MsbA